MSCSIFCIPRRSTSLSKPSPWLEKVPTSSPGVAVGSPATRDLTGFAPAYHTNQALSLNVFEVLITAKDHTPVQIVIADVDANGRGLSTSTLFALSGPCMHKEKAMTR